MKKYSGYIYIVLGAVCLLIAAYIIKNNLDESLAAGEASNQLLSGVIAQIPDTVLAAEKGDMPVADVDGRSFIGTVEIPSLGLLLPIQSEWATDNAKVSVCRYKGSVYENDLIIAGHNYTEHFGRLNELNSGDEVIVTDMNGKSFYFIVSNIETLGAYDVEEMEKGEWDLTLFTCTIGGANRVTVRCEATGEVSETGTVPDVIDAAQKSKHIRK
ncbi:MAG: sortase [Butyrivibrio sp.]|nr:sortase [Butyrivibrio sp.]MBQ9589017.1 sortase [Butyrivibrio sp.]